MRSLCESVWETLNDIVIFLRLEFARTEVSSKANDATFELSPSGIRYMHDEASKAARWEEVGRELQRLIDNLRDAFRAYRAEIRNKLRI